MASKLNETSALVCIAYTPREDRFLHHLEQWRAFAEWPGRVSLILMTTADDEAQRPVHDLIKLFSSSRLTIEIEQVVGLDDPWMLPWEHKRILKERFLASEWDYFIYTEDDIRISWRNMAYWLYYREVLKSVGLLPSFLRYEIASGNIWLTDVLEPQAMNGRPFFNVDGLTFVNSWPPYQAFVVFDQELATEHCAGPGFGFETSKVWCMFNGPERANIGQSFDGVPDGGWSNRYVVPLTPDALPHYDSLVHHLPNNYALGQGKHPGCGRVLIGEAFSL